MERSLSEQMVSEILPKQGGTYILLLYSPKTDTLEVGRKGVMQILAGYYLYVGSAFGPGGLYARVGRHAREKKTLRWHIDYLRQSCLLAGVYFSTDPVHLEDTWSEAILAWPDVSVPMPGFGSTDSAVLSHLFFTTERPADKSFHALKGQAGQFFQS